MNNSTGKISILIADDHSLVRQAWCIILNTDERFNIVGQCSSGEDAIQQAMLLNPDIIVMDVNLPGISGVEAVKQIAVSSPGSKVLAASQHTQQVYVSGMLEAGAKGYLTKTSDIDEMITAILEIKKGGTYICNEIKNKLVDRLLFNDTAETKPKQISEREKTIIDLIRQGVSSKEMAASLNISVKTVEVHRYNILKKLNMKNSLALVNYINENPRLIWN
jgi:DNA-binding NarL/FixJ family response regulator